MHPLLPCSPPSPAAIVPIPSPNPLCHPPCVTYIFFFGMNDWWCVFICSLIVYDDCQRITRCRQVKIHSHYQKNYTKNRTLIIGRQLWQRKIPQYCLQDSNQSMWHLLYESKNDQGMITLTGLDCHAFDSLCSLFMPDYDLYTPFVPSGKSCFQHRKQAKKGRP